MNFFPDPPPPLTTKVRIREVETQEIDHILLFEGNLFAKLDDSYVVALPLSTATKDQLIHMGFQRHPDDPRLLILGRDWKRK